MRPAKPRKQPASTSRPRPSYPPDVLSDEAHVEFLRSIADICNARADEVERAKAERKVQ